LKWFATQRDCVELGTEWEDFKKVKKSSQCQRIGLDFHIQKIASVRSFNVKRWSRRSLWSYSSSAFQHTKSEFLNWVQDRSKTLIWSTEKDWRLAKCIGLELSHSHATPQTIDMNPGQAHCLALRATTLDLWLEIAKSREFVIQGFIWITNF
jgi:hypothetical protein